MGGGGAGTGRGEGEYERKRGGSMNRKFTVKAPFFLRYEPISGYGLWAWCGRAVRCLHTESRGDEFAKTLYRVRKNSRDFTLSEAESEQLADQLRLADARRKPENEVHDLR